MSNLVSEISGLLWIREIRGLGVFITHTGKEPKCQQYEPRRLWHCSKYVGKRKRRSDPVEPLMHSTCYRFQKDQGVQAWRKFAKFQVHSRNIFKLRKFRKCHMQKAFISHFWEVLYWYHWCKPEDLCEHQISKVKLCFSDEDRNEVMLNRDCTESYE